MVLVVAGLGGGGATVEEDELPFLHFGCCCGRLGGKTCPETSIAGVLTETVVCPDKKDSRLQMTTHEIDRQTDRQSSDLRTDLKLCCGIFSHYSDYYPSLLLYSRHVDKTLHRCCDLWETI